jgi:hypothetical protein
MKDWDKTKQFSIKNVPVYLSIWKKHKIYTSEQRPTKKELEKR